MKPSFIPKERVALGGASVNGKKLARPAAIAIYNIAPPHLPEKKRCILRGYESGRMIGTPFAVAKAENLPLPQVAWMFSKYFVTTSVVAPAELKVKPQPPGP